MPVEEQTHTRITKTGLAYLRELSELTKMRQPYLLELIIKKELDKAIKGKKK